MSATGIIKSKSDGSFVEMLPDGTERPYVAPDTDWAALETMSDDEAHTNAVADPDNPPLTGEQLAGMRRPRGRPGHEDRKIATTIRLDPEVMDYFRKAGAGWQSQINEALRKVAGL